MLLQKPDQTTTSEDPAPPCAPPEESAHPLTAFKLFRDECPERWGKYRMLCKLIRGTSDRCLKDMCPKVLAARDALAESKQRKEAASA